MKFRINVAIATRAKSEVMRINIIKLTLKIVLLVVAKPMIVTIQVATKLNNEVTTMIGTTTWTTFMIC